MVVQNIVGRGVAAGAVERAVAGRGDPGGGGRGQVVVVVVLQVGCGGTTYADRGQ